MTNKMKPKANKPSEQGLKKKDMKKAKEQKTKKTLVSVGKAAKKGIRKSRGKSDPDSVDTTSLMKNRKEDNKSAEVVLGNIKKDTEIESPISSGDEANEALKIKSDKAMNPKKVVAKQKSKKYWKDRRKTDDLKLEKMIKKRKENIAIRKGEREKFKLERVSKKGRILGQ